jgi:hypothetical protein
VRVLITNAILDSRSGTELYVYELAEELKRRGHEVHVYAPIRGRIAWKIEAAGVTVHSSLTRMRLTPDIIHGHHRMPTLEALKRFPHAPAIHICHDHRAWMDATPRNPRIARHFGVSRICVDRLIAEGVAPNQAELLLNWVDMRRFLPRPPLPSEPLRALVFSNYATSSTHLPAVRAACRRRGLRLDVVGAGMRNPSHRPEKLLGSYDVVFAKARAALEAMAVGAAVILCDFTGAGPLVTSLNFDLLRPLNFGFQALDKPLSPDALGRELDRYDPADAARVRDLVRGTAGLASAATDLIAHYRNAIDTLSSAQASLTPFGLRTAFVPRRERLAYQIVRYWLRFRRSAPGVVAARVPGFARVKRAVAGLMARQYRSA